MEATLTAPPVLDSIGLDPVGLIAQVRGALSKSPYLSPRHVQVEATDGNIRLEGTVSSFYQKQMAQELVRRVDGVERVENQLQVNWC